MLGGYVREKGVLTLADAVRRMTPLPAHAMGFPQRGVLRPGMTADVVVFDPRSVADAATFESPHRHPVGIARAIVNGRNAAHDGKILDCTAGRILRGPA